MQEMLDSILTPLIPDERKEVILDCVASLEEMDYSAALDELNQVVMIADSMADSSMFLSRVNDIIHTAQEQVFLSHGLTISQEADTEQRQAILRTVLGIPFYILPDQIQLLLQGEFDNEEILAHLVPMFEGLSFDEVIPFIHEVSQTFIDALGVFINNALLTRGHMDDYSVPVSRIRLLNRLINTIGRDRFNLVLELSNAGIRVGRPLEELLANSMDALDTRNAREATYEIVGLVFFSNVADGQLWAQVSMALDEYTENNLERQMMLTEIADIRKKLGDLQ